MARFKTTQVWSMIHGDNHPSLSGAETKIEGYMPLIDALFPGINYYSVTGFSQIMNQYARPVLKKAFPKLVGKSASEVRQNQFVKVKAFLPSKGYEHLDNPEWKKRLDTLLSK